MAYNNNRRNYVVQDGDSYESIAARTGVDLGQLMRYYGGMSLKSGMVLHVKGLGKTKTGMTDNLYGIAGSKGGTPYSATGVPTTSTANGTGVPTGTGYTSAVSGTAIGLGGGLMPEGKQSDYGTRRDYGTPSNPNGAALPKTTPAADPNAIPSGSSSYGWGAYGNQYRNIPAPAVAPMPQAAGKETDYAFRNNDPLGYEQPSRYNPLGGVTPNPATPSPLPTTSSPYNRNNRPQQQSGSGIVTYNPVTGQPIQYDANGNLIAPPSALPTAPTPPEQALNPQTLSYTLNNFNLGSPLPAVSGATIRYLVETGAIQSDHLTQAGYVYDANTDHYILKSQSQSEPVYEPYAGYGTGGGYSSTGRGGRGGGGRGRGGRRRGGGRPDAYSAMTGAIVWRIGQ
jgi:hypothetical protein